MDKSTHKIDANDIILLDSHGNKETLHNVLWAIISDLMQLNAAVFDDEEHTNLH